MKLGIVIIHYNTSADLDRCLESLTAYPPTAEHEVVIVDNASTDPGLAAVQDYYAGCRWLFNTENLGYAKGCNQGMAEVAADYYLILNPDIVVQPGALDRLLEFADSNPRAGMVGPQLLNDDETIQHSCRRFYTLKTLLLRRTFLGRIFPDSETVRQHLMQDFDHRTSRPVDWVLGGCLLVRASAMARTGPMDERFFLYFEDVDWCYRMWQAGFEVQYTPAARFVHKHRRDSARGRFNRSFWLHLGSLISFYEKWGMMIWLLKKWRDPLLMFLWWAVDMAGLTLAFWSAYGLRGMMGRFFAEPLYAPREYVPLLVFAGLLATATFLFTGRYRAGALRLPRLAVAHLRQVGVVSVLLLASTYLGHQDFISRAVLLLFVPLLAIATALGEEFLRGVLRRLERGHFNLERTLLAGPPVPIQEWLAGARDLKGQGVDLAGYLADPGAAAGLPPLAGGEVPWLGGRDEILEVVRRYRISQVVFWDSPESRDRRSDRDWQLLAALRRLRVRLRWHVGGAWLLAAAARPEIFGSELSAVRSSDSGMALRVLSDRLLALVVGLLLLVLGFLPWVWLRLIRIPAGQARWERFTATDLWGHEPSLTLAISAHDRVLPLPWQWRLAGPLLSGRLTVFGPRPGLRGPVAVPRAPAEVLAFWRSQPRPPGLAGRWAAPGHEGDRRSLRAVLKQLWFDPGGFGVLGTAPTADSRSGGPESDFRPDVKTDPDGIGDYSQSG